MKNIKKIIIVSTIGAISVVGLFIKGYFDDEKYVLNSEEDIKLEEKIENNKESNIKDSEETISKKKITVYISGEIKKPGVVTLDSDKRLSDAVNILGGVTDNADMNQINLAMKLEDEMHCVIPKKGEQNNYSNRENLSQNNSQVNSQSGKININRASLAELDSIPGVGEATANKIISYIKENGEFKNISELKNVNGIGDKKFENMKDYICVN